LTLSENKNHMNSKRLNLEGELGLKAISQGTLHFISISKRITIKHVGH
jgi:hypothetical protein